MLHAALEWATHRSWADLVGLVGILMLVAAAIIQYFDWKISKSDKEKVDDLRTFIEKCRAYVEELEANQPLGPGHKIKGQEIDDIEKIMREATVEANRKNQKTLWSITDQLKTSGRTRDIYVRISFALLIVGAILTGFPIAF